MLQHHRNNLTRGVAGHGDPQVPDVGQGHVGLRHAQRLMEVAGSVLLDHEGLHHTVDPRFEPQPHFFRALTSKRPTSSHG